MTHVRYASHLNQMRSSGSALGATRYFFDMVEAAAVHLPGGAGDAGDSFRRPP